MRRTGHPFKYSSLAESSSMITSFKLCTRCNSFAVAWGKLTLTKYRNRSDDACEMSFISRSVRPNILSTKRFPSHMHLKTFFGLGRLLEKGTLSASHGGFYFVVKPDPEPRNKSRNMLPFVPVFRARAQPRTIISTNTVTTFVPGSRITPLYTAETN